MGKAQALGQRLAQQCLSRAGGAADLAGETGWLRAVRRGVLSEVARAVSETNYRLAVVEAKGTRG